MPALRDLRPLIRRSARTNADLAASSADSHRHIADYGIYVDGERKGDFECYREAMNNRELDAGFAWINLHEPSDTELVRLAEQFGLHPLAVEDALHARQRPKIEQHDGTLFAVFKTVRYTTNASDSAPVSDIAETGDIIVFLGQDFVLTIQHGKSEELHNVRRRLESIPEKLRGGPAAVLHAIADRIVDDYMTVTEFLQNDVERVETAIFSHRHPRDGERIYALKREVLSLRHAINPLISPLQTLSEHPTSIGLLENREYFRDILDNFTRVSEHIASLDELLTTLVQANLAQVTVAQNDDMRKISAWVAIISVPTAVAGLYGMNFDHMPELHWRYGYPMVLTIVFALCFRLYRGFRRNGWL